MRYPLLLPVPITCLVMVGMYMRTASGRLASRRSFIGRRKRHGHLGRSFKKGVRTGWLRSATVLFPGWVGTEACKRSKRRVSFFYTHHFQKYTEAKSVAAFLPVAGKVGLNARAYGHTSRTRWTRHKLKPFPKLDPSCT